MHARSFGCALLIVLMAATASFADNEGRDDLDRAAEARLSADSVRDLDEVIRLAETAVKKGLDESNTAFAKSLLGATLTQRGAVLAALATRAQQVGDPRAEEQRKRALKDLRRAVELDDKQGSAWIGIAELERLPGGDAKKADEAIEKALAVAEDDPAIRSRALQLRTVGEKDPQKRLADLDAAIELAPNDAVPLRARAAVKTAIGQFDGALADLDKALEIAPEHGPTLEAKALIQARLKRFDDALVTLDALQKLEPEAVAPRMQKARIRALQGEMENAIKELDVAHNLDPRNAAILLLRAALETDPTKRMDDVNEAVKVAPTSALALRTRSLLYAERGEYTQALADVDKLIELQPDAVEGYQSKIALLAKLQRWDEAVAVLDALRAKGLAPAVILAEKARLRVQQKNFDAALSELNKAITDTPANTALLLLRAGVFEEKGDRDRALSDIDAVLAIEPESTAALRFKAALLGAREQWKAGIALLEAALARNPKDMDLTQQLAFLYGGRKDHLKAIELFGVVLADEPDDFVALRGRGDSFLNIGKHKEAIADYETALKLRPSDSGLLNNLAWVLATSPMDDVRDGKRAIELATKSCDLTQYKEAHILSTLAAAYAETGDFENALRWVKKGIELGNEKEKTELAKELQSYSEHKPVRELMDEKPGEDEPNADAAKKTEGESSGAKDAEDSPASISPQSPKADAPHTEAPKADAPSDKPAEPKATDKPAESTQEGDDAAKETGEGPALDAPNS